MERPRLGIFGANGRMGRAIAAVAREATAPTRGCDRTGADFADPEALARTSDVLVDFSVPNALPASLRAARCAGVPILVGTTGLAPEHYRMIDDAARDIPVLQAANTSLGVTLLAHLAREAAARLGPDWDAEIMEMHHRRKVDAPSGTALLLGEAVAAGRGTTLAEARSPVDRAGPRAPGAIGFAALRGGSVAGDHRLIFAGEGERLEFSHVAESREVFARGALRGALWLVGKPAGRYRMADVLGLV